MDISLLSIRGFGGAKVWNVWMGVIKWDIEDDEGVTHTHIIPKSYYIPQGHVQLLSPQHWAQSRTGIDKRGGAGTMTTAVSCKLFWNNDKSSKATGWFGRFVLSTEWSRTRKLDYNDLNWPRCSTRVTESLALTDGGFCQSKTLYILDNVNFVSL